MGFTQEIDSNSAQVDNGKGETRRDNGIINWQSTPARAAARFLGLDP